MFGHKFLPLVALIALNFQFTSAANILAIFQNPARSHNFVHAILMRALAARGHNLTIFTAHPIEDLKGNSNVVQHHFNKSFDLLTRMVHPLKYKQERISWPRMINLDQPEAFYEITRKEIAHPAVQELLGRSQGRKIDALIIECHNCHLVRLADIYDCPIIVSTAGESHFTMHGLMGNDISPALYPENSYLPFRRRHLTFSERIESLLHVLLSTAIGMLSSASKYSSRLNEQFFPFDPVDIGGTLQRRTALLLTYTSVAFGHVRPLMPNTVPIGFMHVEPSKEIRDQKLLQFLDKSTNGAIVMGFGSLVDTKNLDLTTSHKLLNVLARCGMNVVWKSHENDRELPPNVLARDWLPLADVLAHSNVKALITHGGLLTAYEAIDRLVPMIVFPLVYDEAANARMLVHNGVAVELDLNSFTEDELLSAINEVQSDEFKASLRRLRQRVYDQPMSSRELAVWHIESVIRNGNDLKVETSSYEEQFKRYFVDVIVIGLASGAVSLIIASKVIRMRRNRKKD